MRKEKIMSESSFIFKLIISIIKVPFYLILFLFGRKKLSDVFAPFKHIKRFLSDARFTSWIIFANVVLFIVSILLPEEFLLKMINYPENIFSINFYTIITSGFLDRKSTRLNSSHYS